MNTTTIDSKTAALLSRILGRSLADQEITPSLVFLTALVALLTGTMMADNSASEVEKQLWQKTIKRFISEDKDIQEVVKLLFQGIREQKIHQNFDLLKILVSSLSPSERLLLLGFGYEMSAADVCISTEEREYLSRAATCLDISKHHQEVLESAILGTSIPKTSELEELLKLLDPARFHELDTILIKAADDLLASVFSNIQEPDPVSISDYPVGKLSEFKSNLTQLMSKGKQLEDVLRECIKESLLPPYLLKSLEEENKRGVFRNFRVSVVGEFSQGKSTLLNALLREDVQPVRAIPCSGVLTILRFGDTKRIVCQFKDGHEEEISIEQYKEKASIPREAACENRFYTLAEGSLPEKIIFERPDLVLCKNGVEIVDSPGLNEHPERTQITKELLSNTDAVIFLVNAARLLPEKERELIIEIKNNILIQNPSISEVDNLFVVANFIDQLDSEEDFRDVKQRLENFLSNENVISNSESRVHYISAKLALKAILSDQENEWIKAFDNFTNALEDFLVNERGYLQVRAFSEHIDFICRDSLEKLEQAEDLIRKDIHLSEQDKQKLFERMSSIAAHGTRISLFAENLLEEIAQEGLLSFQGFVQDLESKLRGKSQNWKSENNTLWGQKGLTQDYTQQFINDLNSLTDEWAQQGFTRDILDPKLRKLDLYIRSELESVEKILSQQDLSIGRNLSQRIQSIVSNMKVDSGYSGLANFCGTLGTLSVMSVAAFLGPIGAVVALLTLGVSVLKLGSKATEIKEKIVHEGMKKFLETQEQIYQNFEAEVLAAVNQYVDYSSQAIDDAIELYENYLVQCERTHSATLEQAEERKAAISARRENIEKIQQAIHAI